MGSKGKCLLEETGKCLAIIRSFQDAAVDTRIDDRGLGGLCAVGGSYMSTRI